MGVVQTYVSAFLLVVTGLAIGFALWNFGGLSTTESVLAVAVLLLGAAQLISYINRDRTQERTVAHVNDLSVAGAQAARDIDVLKNTVDEMQEQIAQPAKLRDEELLSQFEVLETLVKQLAEEVANSKVLPETHREPSGEAASADHTANGQAGGAAGANGPAMHNPQLVDKVRQSLENNRVDLYLQPVVSLPQRKTRYYEALTRLRDASGNVIMPASYLEIAEHAGIMPMIDNLLLFRCVKVVRRLVERNRDIGVFCNISARSLLDAEFFPHFLEFLQQNQELSGALVFEFSQDTLDTAGPLELESLALLHEMGFRFSLDHVANLDIDFGTLADRGFSFLKVGASTMIDGMKNAGAQIHSADLKDLLSRYGIELIVEKVESENQVVTLLDYEVGMGQGYLFSEPRLVREDVIENQDIERRRAS